MKTLVLKYFVGLLNSLADVLTECCSYHHFALMMTGAFNNLPLISLQLEVFQ